MKVITLGATQAVTGSCFLVQLENFNLLVDCGLHQGNPQAAAQNKHFPFDPKLIDAVALTHAHLDHSGLIPKLCKQGFNGKIYAHQATKDLCEVLLSDSALIQEHEHNAALYCLSDVENAMAQFQATAYGTLIQLNANLSIRFVDAGHIIGSASVEVCCNDNKDLKRCVFSGDLGHRGAPLLKQPACINKACDFIFLESTYGAKRHRPWTQTWDELKSLFINTNPANEVILIPAFAVGRIQELLYAFHHNYDEWGLASWNFYLDSPMGLEATKIYSKYWQEYDQQSQKQIKRQGSPFAMPNLRLCLSQKQSKALNDIKHGIVIIAGSGMCDSGRILHHIKHRIGSVNCHVLITGYQAQGTLGRKLQQGAAQISIDGDEYTVNAKTHTISGLSAHADVAGLKQWLACFEDIKQVALVHGEFNSMQALAQTIEDSFAIKAQLPQTGDCISI